MKATVTERLQLRAFRTEDAEAIHPLFCDREAMRLVGMYPPYQKLYQTQERIKRWMQHERHRAVVLKDEDRVIGYIVVNPDSSEEKREDTRELGFALLEEYRGKGYVREAVTALMPELKESGVRYLWACCFKENQSSKKTICGLGFELKKEEEYDAPNDRRYESLCFCRKL